MVESLKTLTAVQNHSLQIEVLFGSYQECLLTSKIIKGKPEDVKNVSDKF